MPYTLRFSTNPYTLTGRPQDESSWGRRLIVNDVLTQYFHDSASQEDSSLVDEVTERMRLQSRIRAFAWAPAPPTKDSSATVGTRLSWGQHILAVSNDYNEVVFVLIESPSTTLGAKEDWTAKVIDQISLATDSKKVTSLPLGFEDIMQQQRHASHLSWSPWTFQEESYHSVLVYATTRDIRAHVVTYTDGTTSLGDEIAYPDLPIQHSGPMRWSPLVQDDNKVTMAVFTISGVTCLTISAIDATILNCSFHNLDGRWAEISATIWDLDSDTFPRLHFSSLQATMAYPTVALQLSENGLLALPSPNWREHINDTQALFSAQNELKGNVKSKIWGLSTSPLGDFIASCHTMHPSDMIEYGPPANRLSTLAIHSLRNYNQISFPARNVSAEGIAYSLRKWADNSVDDADHMPGFTEQILTKMMQVYGPASEGPRHEVIQSGEVTGDLARIIMHFKQETLLHPHNLKDRYSILISHVCSRTSSSGDLARTLIAYRLARTCQSLLGNTYNITPYSSEILFAHHQVVALVDSVMNASDPEAAVVSTAAAADTCDFCEASIPFTDLKSATCLNGHHFPRCGLSFLAIQAPRITKYCGICNTPFLSNEFVLAQEVGSSRSPSIAAVPRPTTVANSTGVATELDSSADVNVASGPNDREDSARQAAGATEERHRELPNSLARILFFACDVCIYCSGKFVG